MMQIPNAPYNDIRRRLLYIGLLLRMLLRKELLRRGLLRCLQGTPRLVDAQGRLTEQCKAS